MTQLDNISIGSDVLITLDALTNAQTGAYLNAASVSGYLWDRTRTTTIGTFSMGYVSSSSGRYRGTLPASTTTDLTEGTEYKIQITATNSGATRSFWASTTAAYD